MAKPSRRGEFVELLHLCAIGQSELARRLGLHRNTVSKWGGDVPEYALAYLRLLAGIRALARSS